MSVLLLEPRKLPAAVKANAARVILQCVCDAVGTALCGCCSCIALFVCFLKLMLFSFCTTKRLLRDYLQWPLTRRREDLVPVPCTPNGPAGLPQTAQVKDLVHVKMTVEAEKLAYSPLCLCHPEQQHSYVQFPSPSTPNAKSSAVHLEAFTPR